MSESLADKGAQHLSDLSRDQRRDLGKVYTPHPLADFVLDQALGLGGVPTGPVLDPACGAGVFLQATVARIADALTQLGLDVRTDGRRTFLREVKETVWGIDVDPAAAQVARTELRATIERLSPGPLAAEFMTENIVVGDYLRDSSNNLIPVRPSLIVGNPPYVTADRISAADKGAFRATFETAFGRIDLYTLFMERSVRALEEGGTWAFITPDKYLTSESARPIRRLLRARGTIRSLALFQSHRVFEGAATVPCVTVWQAKSPTDSQVAVNRVVLNSDDMRTPRIEESINVSSDRLLDVGWSFQRRANESLARRLLSGHPQLHEWTSRISAGLTTGYNPAFVIDEATASRLEPDLVHRSLRGRDVLAHEIRDRREYMLVPYVWTSEGTSRLINLDEFPKTKRWLQQHRERLGLRHCVREWGKHWWDLHDPVSAPLHLMTKVVVPDLARSNRFAADAGRYIPQHSAYYLIPNGVPADVLAAVLNSPPIEFLMRTQAPLVKDGFSRYRRQFLRNLPVPEIDPTTQQLIQRSVAERRHDDLDVLTTELFGVDVQEVRRALDDLSRSR